MDRTLQSVACSGYIAAAQKERPREHVEQTTLHGYLDAIDRNELAATIQSLQIMSPHPVPPVACTALSIASIL